MTVAAALGSNCLLFALVFGMSATVDIASLKKQLHNKSALLTGILLQFGVLPFLGFVVVKALNMSPAMGITLLVVTSSPGGSYSNWWCSMFNADLALSVTMTAMSTLISIVMLPVNLLIYATSTYDGDVVKSLDWTSLFVSLAVVIGAIALGLLASAKVHSHKFNLICNKLGNIAGLALVFYSVFISNSGEDADLSLWGRDWKFYLGVASPCVLALVVSNFITSGLKLDFAERVTVSVECCYQNVGIATSVAITMFEGTERSEAIGVPLYYGLVEAVVLGFYCLGAWKVGWTKAPKDEHMCIVIFSSYEVQEAELHDPDAVEVVLGYDKDGLPSDLILQYDEEEGYKLDQSITKNKSGEEEKSEVELSTIQQEDKSSFNQKRVFDSFHSVPSREDSFAENYSSPKNQAQDSVQSPLSDKSIGDGNQVAVSPEPSTVKVDSTALSPESGSIRSVYSHDHSFVTAVSCDQSVMSQAQSVQSRGGSVESIRSRLRELETRARILSTGDSSTKSVTSTPLGHTVLTRGNSYNEVNSPLNDDEDQEKISKKKISYDQVTTQYPDDDARSAPGEGSFNAIQPENNDRTSPPISPMSVENHEVA